MAQTLRPTDRRTNDAMTIASHLIGHDGINAIHIATGKRPNYDDLVRYREMADEEGLCLTVEAHALVMRRPHAPDETVRANQPSHSEERKRRQVTQAAARTWHWASDHVSSWQAGFIGIHEGVR